MENSDTKPDAVLNDHSDEEMLLNDVIQGDHELLYLDSYLREILGQ